VRLAPAVSLVLIALASNPGRVHAKKTETMRDWLDGPVRYLVNGDEIKEFKAQKTDADRAAFVERFWRKRDPTPDTLVVNETRILFWNRVKEANEKFLDSAAPGWKTDRGKIYILYGPPDEVKEDPNATMETKASDGAGLIRWVYLKPGGRRDVDPFVFVPFVRNTSGEYKLSYDPELASPFFNWNSIDDRRTAGLDEFMKHTQAGVRTPISVMLDLGKLQEVPPPEKVILDSVESVETFAYLPLPLAIDRFQQDDGRLVAIVTVSIPGPTGTVAPTLMARFARRAGTPPARLLGEGSFRIEGDGPSRVAQARVTLENATWDVTVLAIDPESGVSRIFRGPVAPLTPGPSLRLSDVVVAQTLEPLPYATQATYDAPFIVGGFRVVPRVANSLPRGEPLRLFYEINGGKAPFQIAYQLEGQEKDGRWRPLGKPQEREGTTKGQGFELPTGASWPASAYRVRVTVLDAAGDRAEGVAAFVVGDVPPPQEPPAAPVVREP
jgi:GWxTD domain-containing protein